jgi:hypothetical protein
LCGNALFAARMRFHSEFHVLSTYAVENVADLSRLTSYKDFFISFRDDEFAQYHAGLGRSDAVANRVSGAAP